MELSDISIIAGAISVVSSGLSITATHLLKIWKGQGVDLFKLQDDVQSIMLAVQRCEDTLSQICSQTRDLHVWHGREDESGVKVWYTSRVVTQVNEVRQQIDRLQDIVSKLDRRVHLLSQQLQSYRNELEDNNGG